MTLPPGHGPCYVGGVLYIAGLDKTIHAVNASNGNKIWQTDEAGMGFIVSPLVVNNRVYAGNLDGYFYCFDASNGSYLWSYQTIEPIELTAAYQTYPDQPQGVVFFAAKDLCAYALNADDGSLIWKTPQLEGVERIQAWWPVIYDNMVIFRSAPMTGSDDNNAMFRCQMA